MIVPKQGYKRQYAFGGTGIFVEEPEYLTQSGILLKEL